MSTIDQLIVAPTSDELFEKMLGMLETAGIPARSWRAGSVARSILGVLADLGAQGAAVVARTVAGNFLAFATGNDLTFHAEDVYGVTRIAATFATGTIRLTNGGTQPQTVGADQLIVASTVTGARFRVTQGFTLAVNTSLDLPVTALEAGAASSVVPGDINTLETPLAKVTVTNPASIVGVDRESDEALRARALAKKGTWSPFGPRDAYEFAALSAKLSGGTATSINRVAVSPASSTGTVTIICATPTGTPSAAELDAVRAAVEQYARPGAVTATVAGAIPKPTAKTIRIWARGGVAATLLAGAQAALAQLLATYRIGGIAKDGGQGYLYDDRIAATVIGSSPFIYDVDIIAGAGDVALAPNEVAVNTTTFEVRIQ